MFPIDPKLFINIIVFRRVEIYKKRYSFYLHLYG